VEKKTFKISIEVLKRFQQANLLKSIVLIGSWSVYFYKDYFKSKEYSSFIRTLDMDFLIPLPAKIKENINVLELVKDLGFVKDFKGTKGYIKLVHPDLIIEFFVPERGKGIDKPYSLPQLGINAVALRYLDFLADNVITITSEGLKLVVPHPAAYALHKLIIQKRRKSADKQDKDLESASRVFYALLDSNEHKAIKRIFKTMHKKWQATVLKNLKSVGELEIIALLKS